MEVRPLRRDDVAAAGQLLHDAFARVGQAHGYGAPWPTPEDAAALCARSLDEEPEGALAAVDGVLVGAGFVRRRGETATIGPLATSVWGRGIGGKLLDELIARAEAWGCLAVRLFQDAWNPMSFALYAGRSFAPVDVAAVLERPPGKVAPGGSRGLEIVPFEPRDLPEVMALDHRLTGHERGDDLRALTALVARRRGALVAFLGRRGDALGPAVALDASDLGAVLSRALDGGETLVARLSTAAPVALPMARALGFRIRSLGTVMVRGPAPPARPPQLYSLAPEVL
ncbi:MAG TPA: GNAT family N-acetyltransferase [Haliangiales bacterium]|nr:GNAT family N-acetyltransferase [Haliangiales bacterium]